MGNEQQSLFSNHDRVNHEVKGLGTVRCDPARDDLVPDDEIMILESGMSFVFVSWDDDRFPVEKVPVAELEKLSAGGGAMSSGY